ncbi:MAG: 16S rRNA (uracil(1498)-N(3))-methyltransferase [Desulfopila sp.]
MNVILLQQHELNGRKARLTDNRAKHIVRVLHCVVGDRVKVGVLHDRIGFATITALQPKYPFMVEIEVTHDSHPPPKVPLDIVLALPRPIMLRRILSQATALGVGKVHIVNAARVEKSFWQAGVVEEDGYMEHVMHGLEQAIDTIPPKIFFHRKFKPFVEEYVPGVADQYRYLVYAHPSSARSVRHCIGPTQGKVLAAVGPEGGWLEYELDKFEEQGFCGFGMGVRILKVDTAVVNMHGMIVAQLAGCR